MPELEKIVADLEQARDEIKLKIHLGAKDLQDEWRQVEERWDAFSAKARIEQSAKDIGDALGILGAELKDAFERIRKAL